MVKNELSIMINRPIQEVFDYVSNLQYGPQWQTGLVEVRQITQGAPAAGSQFASARKFLGRKLEAVIEITAFEPNRKIVVKSPSGSVPFEESFLFEPAAGSTQLTTHITLQTSGFMGLAEPLIAGSLKREMESDFGNLKSLLEHRVPVVPS